MKNAVTVLKAVLERFTCKKCKGEGQLYNDELCPKCDGAGIIFPTPQEEAALDTIFQVAMNTKINIEDNSIEEVETEVQRLIDALKLI